MGRKHIVNEQHHRKVCAAVIWGFLIFNLLICDRSNLASAASELATPDDRLIFLPMVNQFTPHLTPGEPGYCLSAEEVELASLINEYRRSNGKAEVPLSRSLSMVAQWHVRDLQWNNPNVVDSRGNQCGLHSWSDQGYWLPVCYTPDHFYASGMYQKPKEITRGIYTDTGYEIAIGMNGWKATAEAAFNSWKDCTGHGDVILEQDGWSGKRWSAMGVGIYEGYAVTWFSTSQDPLGTIPACGD